MPSDEREIDLPIEEWSKRPMIVRAVQLTHDVDWVEVGRWCGALRHNPHDINDLEDRLPIPTNKGLVWANVYDYIVEGVAGEFYPVAPHIFHQYYARPEAA